MRCQVIVVGAGPGGATAAHFLAKGGVDVLLVDKKRFPRDKACGDAQIRGAQEQLREMEVFESVRRHAHVLRGTTITTPSGGSARFVSAEREIWCTPRYILDDIVRCSAIQRGARFIDEFAAEEVLFEHGQAVGVCGRYGESRVRVSADAVVVADGALSQLALQLGFRARRPDPLYQCYGVRGYFENVSGAGETLDFIYPSPTLFPAGYVWMFPVSETRVNVGVFLTVDALRRNRVRLADYIAWFREETTIGHDRLSGAVMAGALKAALLPTFPLATENVTDGVVAVGDAASMIEPLFGGGVPHAMATGKIAAEVLIEALKKGDVSRRGLEQYGKRTQAELVPSLQAHMLAREQIFQRPEQLEKFVARINEDSRFAGLGVKETLAEYLRVTARTGDVAPPRRVA